jgi:hypothetical protein
VRDERNDAVPRRSTLALDLRMTDAAVADEFARRRRATWRGARWWLIPGIFGIAGLLEFASKMNDQMQGAFVVPLVSVALLVVCLVAIRQTVHHNLRCPNCDTIPCQSSPYGNIYDWNPAVCPKCHVRLR